MNEFRAFSTNWTQAPRSRDATHREVHESHFSGGGGADFHGAIMGIRSIGANRFIGAGSRFLLPPPGGGGRWRHVAARGGMSWHVAVRRGCKFMQGSNS
jgi:hypothetical protein